MQVADIMRRQTRVCSPGNSLATAGRIMADAGCGLLPVLDSDDKVVAVITDRDVCVALAQRDRKASEVRVSEIVSGEVHSCGPDEDVRSALTTMREHRIRRLPVLDGNGHLHGLLVLDDAVLARAYEVETSAPGADLLETLKAVRSRCPRG